jgi:lipid II isoglutaminyl synthase (glutamine-hydrolysing)
MSKLTIVHLYPEEMNIYGDGGNVLALSKRLQWRGIEHNVVRVGVGDDYDFASADIVFGGGGQDKGQTLVAEDLQTKADSLRTAASDGVVMLTICGMYQLFGHGFTPHDGDHIKGIGIFDAETVGGDQRMIGNVIVDTAWGQLVGFENHSGVTTVGVNQPTLGSARMGNGNDGISGEEGAVTQNVYGTYLHGSLLPKNPQFADHLLLLAAQRKFGNDYVLPDLDDDLEQLAHHAATKLVQ